MAWGQRFWSREWPSLQAVLFDIGGTLVEFVPESTYQRGLERGSRLAYDWLREHGKALPPYEEFARRERRALAWGQFWAKLTGRELRAQAVVLKTLARMGVPLLPEEIYDLTDRSYRPFGDLLRPRAAAATVLREVARLGLRLAAVSNTVWPGYLIEEDLARLRLAEHLEFCLFSSYFGRPKPARSIFRQALRMLKVTPAQALFVGDSAWEDIEGARRVGMRTAFINNGSRPAFRRAEQEKVERRKEKKRAHFLLRSPFYSLLSRRAEPVEARGSSEVRADWRIGELAELLPIVAQLAHRQPLPS